jgi:hypothetical protein
MNHHHHQHHHHPSQMPHKPQPPTQAEDKEGPAYSKMATRWLGGLWRRSGGSGLLGGLAAGPVMMMRASPPQVNCWVCECQFVKQSHRPPKTRNPQPTHDTHIFTTTAAPAVAPAAAVPRDGEPPAQEDRQDGQGLPGPHQLLQDRRAARGEGPPVRVPGPQGACVRARVRGRWPWALAVGCMDLLGCLVDGWRGDGRGCGRLIRSCVVVGSWR